jgi:tellurite resistance protein
MAPLMSAVERDQVLRWCRQVAMADGSSDGDESEVLSRIGAVLRGS